MKLVARLRSQNTGIAVIILLAFFFRLYKVDNSVLDWHSFRQADTASVTREYVKHGVNLLVPKYHDLSNIQSGEDNLAGYRMVEFPLINAVVAGMVRAIPGSEVVFVSRVLSIAFSLGTIYLIYLIAVQYSGKRVATVAALIAALLPYYVFYSRVVMPEPALLFFSTASIVYFQYWLKTSKWYWYLGTLLCLTVAFLLKPFTVFLAPVFIAQLYFFWRVLGRRWLLVVALPLLAISPFLWWRSWIEQYPSGIPASDWLFNGNGIRFRPAWFRWLFYERLTKLMLGWVGLLFMFTSLHKLNKKELIFYGSWWAGMIMYLSIIATGNVQHDYYQTLLVPIVVITAARGIIMAERLLKEYIPRLYARIMIVLLVIVMLLLAWNQVKGYFSINHWEYVTAGEAVDRLVPADAKVIAPAFGDTQFLYQTNRTGWPIGYEIEKKRAMGAQYYVSTSYDDEARELEGKYFTIEKTPLYILIDLTRERDL